MRPPPEHSRPPGGEYRLALVSLLVIAVGGLAAVLLMVKMGAPAEVIIALIVRVIGAAITAIVKIISAVKG
jgi:hypothetical protein